MKIIIETIPHDQQRYDTAGDYWVTGTGPTHPPEDETWQIRVSEMKNRRHMLLIALHELTEMILYIGNNTPYVYERRLKAVDDFDTKWTPHDGVLEPGDDNGAPYYYEHQIATGVERIVAAELGVDWAEYDSRVNALGEDDDKP